MLQMKDSRSSAPEVSFDPSLYPRTYSVPLKSRSWIAVGFVLAAGSTIGLWRLHALTSQPKALILPPLALFFGYCLLRVLTLKVILEPGAVTVRDAFSTRTLLRQEIAGWRAGIGGAGTATTARTLVPKDDGTKAILLPETRTDGEFFAWFLGLPQLKPINTMDTPPQASFAKGALTFVGLLIVFLATFLFWIYFLDGRPFEIQTISLIADTEFVFLFVFFDSSMGRGYSLRNKAVQRQLPQLLQIHFVSLVLLFALITFARSARPHLPHSWLLDPGYRYSTSPFVSVLFLIGVAIVITQVLISRKILSRASEGAAVLPQFLISRLLGDWPTYRTPPRLDAASRRAHNSFMTPRELAEQICRKLRQSGHQAYLVGGCVRDLLLGREPSDYDVATDARPERVQELFPASITVGARFGVILVTEKGVTEARTQARGLTPGEAQVEVATFRSDIGYSDGRHPDRVEYSQSPEEDVRRRDFTINGLLLDSETGEVLDFVGGREDLRAGLVRAIGEPELRFREDKLRMVRAVRFAARFGYAIEPATLAAIQSLAPQVTEVSAERLRDELTKLLTEGAARRAFELLDQTGLLAVLLPEVARMQGVAQPPQFHPEGDVWIHTRMMLEQLKLQSVRDARLGRAFA